MTSLRENTDLREFVLHNVRQSKQDRTLGTGSYGTVEEVTINDTTYAAKRIHDVLLQTNERGGMEKIVQTYLEECRLMSQIHHPNITQFIGLCFLPGSRLPLLVMERLDTNLDELMETTPNVSLSVKVVILADVARGLLYLHQLKPQVIHRDLTARNVLLTVSFTAKIADFGNSRIVHLQPGQLVRTLSRVPGTIVYMPPEAFSETSRSVYGTSLDVFSFGVLQLFVLTQLFPGDLLPPTYPDPNNSDHILARSEFQRRHTYLDLLEKDLPGGQQHRLFVLVKDCLSNVPERRPTTSHLLSALEGVRTDKRQLQLDISRLKTLKEKDRRIDTLQRELAIRDEQIVQKDALLQEKDTQLIDIRTTNQSEMALKDAVIAQKNLELAQKSHQLHV